MMLRDHAAQLSFGQNGEFNYRVDVSGFRPEEMNVNVEGDDIIVQGQHKSGNEDEQVQRSFYRRVRIPQGIHRESIQCNLDERGRLYVTGKKLQKDQEQSRSIPIGFKKSEALTDMSSDKQAEQNGANRQ
uniref:SHSP domain-containing protein n=1 Tax=Ditylenchus dipsaci TaxID=166011 RepID=A0A915CVJ3_9BILA